MNFATVASQNGNFTLLLAVVSYLDDLIPEGDTTTINLGAALSNDDAALTVFAPLDTAFAALAPALGYTGDTGNLADVGAFYTNSLEGAPEVDPAVLRVVVEYHILGEAKDAAAITTVANAGGTLTTLAGAEITLNDFVGSFALGDQNLTADDPTVLAEAGLANIAASQGFIHVIDKVLLPADLEGDDPNLLDIATTTAGFEILTDVVLLLDTDTASSMSDNVVLVDALASAESDLTVFAPTNTAFANLAANLGYKGPMNVEDDAVRGEVTQFLVDNVPVPTLRAVVEYHILGTSKNAAEINTLASEGGELETLGGGKIDLSGFDLSGTPALGDSDPDLDDPVVIVPNVQATNGIIHGIDNVLLPVDLPALPELNIVETVLDVSGPVGGGESGMPFDDNGGDFDFLREAVVAVSEPGDPDSVLAALSDPDADLTVFAPTDNAFVNLSSALGYDGSDEAGAFDYLLDALNLLNAGNGAVPLLETVLKYHVSAGRQDFETIAANGTVATLLENPETEALEGTLVLDAPTLTLVDADPDIANPMLLAPDAVDIHATNGIIHAIDGVLLPADLLQSDGSNDVDFEIGSNRREFFNTGRDNDFIDAQGGRDSILSGSGDDVVLAGSGRDYVNAGRGDDIVKGESGGDRLFGGSGNDMIDGGSGKDWISGGSGNDTIAGGTGNDFLSGGFGRDTFVFEENGGHDTISFFLRGQDKIDLTAFGIEDFHDIDIDRKGFFRSEIDLGDTQITVNHFFFGLGESDFIL